jgi:hypothetical protein
MNLIFCDFGKALHALFFSDDERAIELSDQVRRVIERKHVSLKKRMATIQQILPASGVHCLVGLRQSLASAGHCLDFGKLEFATR